MKWTTVVDTIEVRIPPLHFGTKRRGRVTGVDFFDGGNDVAKMENFVPANLQGGWLFLKGQVCTIHLVNWNP